MHSTEESVDTPMAPDLEHEEFIVPESTTLETGQAKSKNNILVAVLIVFIVVVLMALGFYIYTGMQNPAPVVETTTPVVTDTKLETAETEGPSPEVLDRMMRMHRDESSLDGDVMLTMENMQREKDVGLDQTVLDRMQAMNPDSELPTLPSE